MARQVFTFPSPQHLATVSPNVRRPQEFTCFSYDQDRELHLNDRSLKYYYPARIGADLKTGFHHFRQYDDSADEHLQSLLEAIMGYEQSSGNVKKADFVTWRGLMTKLMQTPYENMPDGGFEMNATSYIEENHEHKISERSKRAGNRHSGQKISPDMMSFWGYKFETLSTLPDIWDATSREYIEGREDQVVDNYEQYCSIVMTGFGEEKIVLGGEVDAIWDSKPADPKQSINWVELKTSASIQSGHDSANFERKLLKFWIQSFLLGVPKIIVGFRSRDGILEAIEEFETLKLPGMMKDRPGGWDGNLCIRFVIALLGWLKKVIEEGGRYRISRAAKSNTIEVIRIGNGPGEILSPAYLAWLAKRGQAEMAK